MKKLLILSFILTLMLGAALPSVMAQSADDLNALAALYPEDTPLFISLRTDQEFLDNLDSAINKIASELDAGAAVPTDSLAAALDMLAFTTAGTDFATGIRPWLGDTASLGIINLQDVIIDPSLDDPGVMFAIAVNDRQQAADFIRQALEVGGSLEDFTIRTSPDGIRFNPVDENDGYITVTDDAILLTSQSAEKILRNGIEVSLADNDAFADTMAALPADGYGLTMYFDTQAFLAPSIAMASEELPGGILTGFLQASSEASGPFALGLTQLGGSDLTFDVVQTVGDTSAFEEFGFPSALDLPPIDPAFAANVPAGAEFVAHGTGLGPSVTAGFDTVRAFGNLLREVFTELQASGEIPPEADFLTRVNFGSTIIGFTNLSFAGLTGLSLQDDVLAWMTEDFVMFGDIIPDDANTTVVDFEAAVAIRATDPEAALAVVDGLANASEELEFPATRTTINGAEAVILTNPLGLLLPDEAPVEVFDILGEDIVVAANESVFAIGQQDSLDFVLNPVEGESLLANDDFNEAVDFALPDANMLLYLSPQPMLKVIENNLDNVFDADARMGLSLLESVNSISVSSAVGDNDAVVTRFVLALG